jgi:hypothetical protein
MNNMHSNSKAKKHVTSFHEGAMVSDEDEGAKTPESRDELL